MSNTYVETHWYKRFVWITDLDGKRVEQPADPSLEFKLVVFGRTVKTFSSWEAAMNAEAEILRQQMRATFAEADLELILALETKDEELKRALDGTFEAFLDYVRQMEDQLATSFDSLAQDLKAELCSIQSTKAALTPITHSPADILDKLSSPQLAGKATPAQIRAKLRVDTDVTSDPDGSGGP